MRTHSIKIREEYADAVLSGDKTFEIRYNDRGYQTGDQVVFTVIRGGETVKDHPINQKNYVITYVIGGFHVEKDYVVFAIKPID